MQLTDDHTQHSIPLNMTLSRFFFPLLLAVVALLCTASLMHAQTVRTPPEGSMERKAIMDTLRVPCEKDLKQKVIFVVTTFNVSGNWAFVSVTPKTPEGGKIDYKRTRYREQVEAGMFDDNAVALLKKDDDGNWKVLEYTLGNTDAPQAAWGDTYKLPKGLL